MATQFIKNCDDINTLYFFSFFQDMPLKYNAIEDLRKELFYTLNSELDKNVKDSISLREFFHHLTLL